MRKAINIARDNLISLGTCLGKFTKTGKFKIHITALDFLAPYAKVIYHKWIHDLRCTIIEILCKGILDPSLKRPVSDSCICTRINH